MKTIRIKVNTNLPPYMEGQLVTVPVDEFRTPIKRFWRDRLRDAEVDSCVEVVEDKPSAAKRQPKKDSPKEES